MMPDVLKKYVRISVAVHVVMFLILFFSGSFRLNFKPKSEITYIRLSKGDGGTNTKANLKKLKSLPSSTVRDQKKALEELAKLKELPKEKTDKPPPLNTKAGPEKAQPPVDKKKIVIGGGKTPPPEPKNASKTDDALAKINERLHERQDQLKQIEIGSAQAKNDETGQSQFGGAEGMALDPALIAYYNELKRKITSAWLLAKDKFTGQLIAKVDVLIDAEGKVVKTSFSKTSGDGSFDDSALRAVQQASPFPVPPEAIRDEALSDGFTFTFNPETVSGDAKD